MKNSNSSEINSNSSTKDQKPQNISKNRSSSKKSEKDQAPAKKKKITKS
jgi:hypothetical protein